MTSSYANAGDTNAEDGGTWDPLAGLTDAQVSTLHTYADLLLERNQFVNLVSRSLGKEDVWRHIEHCLALRLRAFPPGARIVDWGSGGGLPAIPLAITAPHVTVTAVDATRKKVDAITQMATELGLTNLRAEHARAEMWNAAQPVDYSVSRATAPLVELWQWHVRVRHTPAPAPTPTPAPTLPAAAPPPAQSPASTSPTPATWQPGLIAFKGGLLADELAALHRRPRSQHEVIELEPRLGPRYTEKVLISVADCAV